MGSNFDFEALSDVSIKFGYEVKDNIIQALGGDDNWSKNKAFRFVIPLNFIINEKVY